MSITIIAAMNKNGAIGKDGKLPWHIPSEMKHFKRTTIGGAVCMGFKTFEELGLNPLKGRHNIVCTNKPMTDEGSVHDRYLSNILDGVEGNNLAFCRPLKNLLEDRIERKKHVFIIGGASIYEQALPFADKMILSVIDIEVEGADKFFPAWDKEEWRLTESKRIANEGEPIYFIETWERRKCS